MTDRNREDLERDQSGSSNQNESQNPGDRPEHRSTREGETDRMSGPIGSENIGVGDTDGDSNLGRESEGAGNRSTGNIEGDENLNRR
ncbi:MAG: hypothetical protein M3Q55_09475 [Acidobacteriota bacterium]|nr:hypothetical protein [Acidobacteriota bacterium]